MQNVIKKKCSFSVCMSVYKNDRADDFEVALMSIFNQTCCPDEIILVVDGPITEELSKRIEALKGKIGILKVIPLVENMGHAVARQTGLNAAKNELCAVMDSDDISIPDRFEKQLRIFQTFPEVSVVGGLICEFVNQTDNVVGVRTVPETDKGVKKYMKSRCPMNLVTVMCKKQDVFAVGGYQDWYCEEDYYLWIRMALAGYKFYNIQECLVNVRVGDEMYRRRGGLKYFRSEACLQKYMLEHNVISFFRYLNNILIRFTVQVVMPNWLRGWVFQKFARK